MIFLLDNAEQLLTSLLTLRCTADLWRRREAWTSWSVLLSGDMSSIKSTRTSANTRSNSNLQCKWKRQRGTTAW
jgi:hypothetical protein